MSFKDRLRPYFQTRPRDPATGRPTRRSPVGRAAPAPAPDFVAAGGTNGSAAASASPPSPELLRRRDELARRLAELQWDLGGLTYEMAIRDHFRLDVLVRRAAELQSVDADLGAVEMLLRTEQAGASGACASCGALHSRGAVFCWQCGTSLMVQATVAADGVARPSEAPPPPPRPPQSGQAPL